jgi:hypothetical protein
LAGFLEEVPGGCREELFLELLSVEFNFAGRRASSRRATSIVAGFPIWLPGLAFCEGAAHYAVDRQCLAPLDGTRGRPRRRLPDAPGVPRARDDWGLTSPDREPLPS